MPDLELLPSSRSNLQSILLLILWTKRTTWQYLPRGSHSHINLFVTQDLVNIIADNTFKLSLSVQTFEQIMRYLNDFVQSYPYFCQTLLLFHFIAAHNFPWLILMCRDLQQAFKILGFKFTRIPRITATHHKNIRQQKTYYCSTPHKINSIHWLRNAMEVNPWSHLLIYDEFIPLFVPVFCEIHMTIRYLRVSIVEVTANHILGINQIPDWSLIYSSLQCRLGFRRKRFVNLIPQG